MSELKEKCGIVGIYGKDLPVSRLAFFGLFALRRAIPNTQKAQKATAIMALVGALDLPIIHYSVYWWHSLHQNSTLLGFHKPAIDVSMLVPLLVMLAAFLLFASAAILATSRHEIIRREKSSLWVQQECV